MSTAYQPNTYIWSGHSVLLDKYNDVNPPHYDQTFEDGEEVHEDVPVNNQTLRQSQIDSVNQSISMRDTKNNLGNSTTQPQQVHDNPTKEFVEKEPIKYKEVPEELIENLRMDYYAHRGYTQYKPKELFNYYIDFKNRYQKYKLKNKRLEPLLPYSNDDIFFSLNKSYDRYLNLLNSGTYQITTGKILFSTEKRPKANDQIRSKFSRETLKRIYPREKQLEENEKAQMNCYDFPNFFVKLLVQFRKDRGAYTNDNETLLQYWRDMKDDEEREKRGLQWENGEKDLEMEMTRFLSDDEIVKRLIAIFKKVCGYETNHPRPLHDYWQDQITEDNKFLKGLYKYNKDGMFCLLEDKYNQSRESQKEEKEKIEREAKEAEDKKEKERKLKIKNEREELEKRFSEMAKPKDRWRTGRIMLKLKDQFKYDNILDKMIKNEFIDNREFKFPEEYAVYDDEQQRQILFKNQLEKGVKTDAKIRKIEERNKQYMIETHDNDAIREGKEGPKIRKMVDQDRALESYIKSKVKLYYKKMRKRLGSGKIELISKFLNGMYQEMMAKHKDATKRRFPKTNYGVLKKSLKYKKLHTYYPESLKFYFFQLLRRLGVDDKGKLVFAHFDNLSFWGPSLSNHCKVHSNGCPLYCIHNTHNSMILKQRSKNFKEIFEPNTKLREDEKFNMWKRPELIKEKQKIFMCLSEAEHCTFEPKINQRDTNDNKDKQRGGEVTVEELVDKRVNNMEWVNKMGKNFAKFPVLYKEGICKQAKLAFADGQYDETLKLLNKAFDLDQIKAFFEPKYALELKKKRIAEEEERKNKNEEDPNEVFKKEEEKKKTEIVPDDFKKPKNKEICTEVYFMMKAMENYKKKKNADKKRLKEEIDMIEYNKKISNNEIVDTKNINTDKRMNESNPHFAYVKDKYFKYFKTLMCPLKNQCPYLLQRWPSSDIGASVPFGIKCPYAHQISELKFEKEIEEKIKLRKNLLKSMSSDKNPAIQYEWVPTGPLVPCNGCAKLFSEKNRTHKLHSKPQLEGASAGICNFCRYKQKNELDMKRNTQATQKANEKILEKINYQGNPEEIDQDYVKKFGMLKRAIVLFDFRRYTDSRAIMEKLMNIIYDEKGEIEKKFEDLDVKWRKKLEIKESIPFEILNYNITEDILKHFKIQTPLAKLLLYCEKMKKGNKFSIYNRHTYLNRQIEDFYNLVMKTLGKYNTDINHLTKQIRDLDDFILKKEKLKKEKPKFFQKMSQRFKKEMCPNILKLGTCPKDFRTCPYAHHSNQINYVSERMTKKLMLNNMRETKEKLKQSTTTVPWSYARQGYIEEGLKYDKHMVDDFGIIKPENTYKRSKSAKKLQERDLEKLKIKCHEI